MHISVKVSEDGPANESMEGQVWETLAHHSGRIETTSPNCKGIVCETTEDHNPVILLWQKALYNYTGSTRAVYTALQSQKAVSAYS